GGAGRSAYWPISFPPLLTRYGFRQMRLIHAARVFRQEVAGERKGSRPRPAADFLIFADSALPFPLGGIAQGAEESGVPVDIHQRIVEHVAAAHRQEAAGENFALV